MHANMKPFLSKKRSFSRILLKMSHIASRSARRGWQLRKQEMVYDNFWMKSVPFSFCFQIRVFEAIYYNSPKEKRSQEVLGSPETKTRILWYWGKSVHSREKHENSKKQDTKAKSSKLTNFWFFFETFLKFIQLDTFSSWKST